MKYSKLNRYEKKEMKSRRLEQTLHGEGLYLYENNSAADLTLPRPTKSGLRSVGPRQQFQGDDYYMQYVRQGHLRLIKELQSPANERLAMEQKLILDQPETVTEKGKVEHVVDGNQPSQKLQEAGNQPQPDVLLNEGPVEGGFVIVGE